jgi:hypothetical protein
MSAESMWNALARGDVQALADELRAVPVDPAIEREVYRGAQFGRASDGDEWLRRAELIQAGQQDMFATSNR